MPRDHLDALDPGFPIEHVMPPSAFWEMARLRPDRPALAGLATRARAGEAGQVVTFTRPLPPPEDLPAVEFVPRPRVILPADDTQGAVRWSEPPAWADDTTLDASEFLAEPLEPLPEMTP